MDSSTRNLGIMSPSQDAYKRGRGTQSPRSTTASITHTSPYGIRMPMTAAAAYSLPYSTAQYTTSPYQSDVPQPRRRISMLNNEFESHRILEQAALNTAKRPRMMQDYTQPLHINTQFVPNIKQEPAYHPQVEAISPTLPQDQGFKDARQKITNQINSVESRIQELEATIKKLESDEERYRAAACAPAGERCESPTQKHQNPLHDILSDNKRKAAKSHQLIIMSSKLENVQQGLALYQQPSDTLQEEIKQKFIKFKPILVAQLKKKFFAKKEREKGSDDLYKKQMQIWLKKVDRFENAAKKKSKDVRTRELYEKVFPEIKRVREERCNNRAHTRSEHQEIDQINDGVQEQEEEIRKRKQLAVIPPLLLDEQERKYKFIDNNRLIKDPLAEYKNSKGKDTVWTDKEREVFRDRFVQHPKNFVIISQFLENKTVSECIHYYYISKKTENYKQLVRKHLARQRGAKGALKKQAVMRAAQLEKDRCEQEAKNKSKEEAVPIVFSRSNRSSFVDVKPMVVTAGCAVRSLENQDESYSNSAPPSNNENREKNSNIQCVVCSTKTCSNFYTVTSANHSSYGISNETLEESMKRDGEVKICNNCRIRQRRKSFECPLAACSRPKTKVKRLRPLPNKLKTVSDDIREDIFKTFGIADGMNKCCQPCFNRICRRLGTNDPETEANRWTDEEMIAAKEALKDFGRNWAAISAKVGTKSEAQCKHFFFNYRKKLGLDDLLKEHTDNRKTSVCESNASTVTAISDSEMPSSVDDEIEGISDETASIASVRTLEEENSKFPTADNDSSATLSADESSQDAVIPKHLQLPQQQQPLHPQHHVSKPHSVSVIQKPPNPINLAQENFLPAIARLQTAQPPVNGGMQQAGEDRRHSPACVRDLIHSAIERNLQPDAPRSDSDATKENIARMHPITMTTSNPMGVNVSISNSLYPELLGARHYRPDPLNRKKEQPRGPPPPAHSNHPYSRPPHFNIPPRPPMGVPPPLVHNNRPLMAGGSIITGTPLRLPQRHRFEGRPPPSGLDESAGSIIKGTPICNESMKGTHSNHDIYEVAASKVYDRQPSNNRVLLQNDFETARQMRTSANNRPTYIDPYDDREKTMNINRQQQSKSPRSVPMPHHHQHPHQQHAQMQSQQPHQPPNQMTAAKLIDIIIHNTIQGGDNPMNQEKTNAHTLTPPRRRRPNESEINNSMPGMTKPKRPSPPPDRKSATFGSIYEHIIEKTSQKVEEDLRANSRIQSMRGIIGSPPEDQKQSQLSPFAASPRPSSISPASTSPRNEKVPSLQSVLDVDTRPRSYSAGPCSKPENKRPSPAVSPQIRVRANTVTAPSPVVKKHQNLANMLNKSSADNSVATSPEAESPASSPKMIIDESASNEPPKQED